MNEMFRSRRRLILLLNLSLLLFLVVWFTFFRHHEQRSSSDRYCLRENITSDEKFHSNLVYIPSLNILFCDVPKAASTNLRRLLISYLHRTNSSDHLNRKQIWIDYEALFKNYYLTKNTFDQLFETSPKHLFKFLIVRHPFQRIYSVYYDKFVNNHLDDTLFGWKQFEEDILLQMNANYTSLTVRRNDIRLDLRTFLRYIIDSIRTARPINSHWQRIAHRCAVCLIHYDFIGKIENFRHDSKILLKKINDNSQRVSLTFPSKELDQKQTKQVVFDDLHLIELFRDTLRHDDDFQVLIDYYKPDFQLFGYSLPH